MKFPHYYQLEAKDCGPTCLKIISKYFGKTYSLPEIKEHCKVSRLGVSLQDIIDGATNLGFETLSIKANIESVKKMPLPAILFWRQEHYVVLYKIKRRKNSYVYFISDPSFGKVVLNEEMFVKHWVGDDNYGVSLLIEPTELFYEKIPKIIRKLESVFLFIRLFSGTVKNNNKRSIIVILLLCFGMICTWIFPSIFQKIIDQGVLGKNMNIVISLLIIQVIIFLSQTVSDSISAVLMMKINFKVSVQFLVDYLYKLIKLPLSIFDIKINSDLLLRMDDSDRIQTFLTHHSLELIISLLNLVVFTILLCHYNLYSFLIFAILSILGVVWTVLFLERRKILDYSKFSVSTETRQNIYELVSEMPEIKINNAAFNKISQWETLQNKLNKINLNALFLNYYQIVGSNFFNKSKDILITALCAYLVIYNKMTLGVMMTIGFILGQLNTPINNLINVIRGIQDTKLSFDRLGEIQCLENEDKGKNIILSKPVASKIVVQNMSFKYEGSFNSFVLHNIDIEIPVGKITAIVGASGSGKTTLMKLLLAIYEPTYGSIYIDNIPLKNIKPDTWRTRCGVVLQDGYIYSDTYSKNIALSESAPDLIKVKTAAKLACIDNFIENLPLGYHTQIGKTGINLSGGQKQRILIARAIYRDPNFLFFDEATSSLDANNEKQIMENMNQFFKGKTVVIIAHRLSTVKNADQIIVLDKGRVIENNCHDVLVNKRGKYFELIKNQLELGI